MNRSILTPELSKTGQITPSAVLKRRIATVTMGLLQYPRVCYGSDVLPFPFLFISAESLENHRKIIK
jgi:hypothetical protein